MDSFEEEQRLLAEAGDDDESQEVQEADTNSPDLVVVPHRHYVDNERLTAELIEWKGRVLAAREKGEETPRISEFVGKCILETGRGVARKHNFREYSFTEDMIMDGCESACRYLAGFNPDAKTRSGKANAFGYISMIMETAFKNLIEKEKLQAYHKYKSLELAGGPEAFAGEDLGGEPGSTATIINDIMSKASEYEELRRRRLIKARAKAAEIKAREARENPPPLMTFWE